MHATSVSQGQRVILHLRFQNKIFICSQCSRNYIYMLIKFINQITEVNHTLLMRILLYCNQHNLLAIHCSGSCIPCLENSVERESRQAVVHGHFCGLGGFATATIRAEITVAAMAASAEGLAIRGTSFKVCNFIFDISSKSTMMYSKLYCIFYLT